MCVQRIAVPSDVCVRSFPAQTPPSIGTFCNPYVATSTFTVVRFSHSDESCLSTRIDTALVYGFSDLTELEKRTLDKMDFFNCQRPSVHVAYTLKLCSHITIFSRKLITNIPTSIILY